MRTIGSARTGMDEAMANLQADDTLVVWRLDRLSRSLKHLIEVVGGLQARGIGFKRLTEQLDTTTPGGKPAFHVFGAPAYGTGLLRYHPRHLEGGSATRSYGNQARKRGRS